MPTTSVPRTPVVAALLVAAVLSTGSARAQDALGIGESAPAPPAPQGTEQAVVARYWELGQPRLFLATTVEAGYAYVRPRVAFGYGQPYWRYVAAEAYPVVSFSGVGHYAGVGAAIPGLQLRVGGRYYYSFSRTLLEPKSSYRREDLDLEQGPTSSYLALEAELTGTVPLFGGSAVGVLTAYRTELVDDGYYLFEESLKAVMSPPYILRGRLGYLFSFGPDGAIRVGPAADVIALPGRSELIVRGGLLGSLLINAHLEIQASFVPVLYSPDQLGLTGGDFGQLGIRHRWATGSTPVRQERLQEPP